MNGVFGPFARCYHFADKMKYILLTLVFVLFSAVSLFPFSKFDSSPIWEKAKANYELMRTEPEMAFEQTNTILKEARRENNHQAELLGLATICHYYTKKNDFKNLIISSENLFRAADLHQSLIYQSLAKEFMFKAYIFNDLPQKAFRQLEEGLAILKKADSNDSLVIETRANLYVSMSNYYALKKDVDNQLKYIKLSVSEHEKFKSAVYKRKMQFVDYSNLAVAYYRINLDSSDYYARKSMALENEFELNDVKFANYIILGNIYQQRGEYPQALDVFRKAEMGEAYKNHFNREILFQSMIDIYNAIQDSGKVAEYQAKLNLLKLTISESKNESLHKIIEDWGSEQPGKSYVVLYVLLFVLVAALVFFFALYFKNRKQLKEVEILSEIQAEERTPELMEGSLALLIDMVKTNDPAFMSSFHLLFPEFSKKLQNICPKIVQTEIEFCALLKLKIPTKDIAKYRNIEHRTVQNKKYIIRRKLNIPSDTDIYCWFDEL